MNARKVSRTEKVQNSGPELKKCREVDILFKFYLRPISEDRSADFRFWLRVTIPCPYPSECVGSRGESSQQTKRRGLNDYQTSELRKQGERSQNHIKAGTNVVYQGRIIQFQTQKKLILEVDPTGMTSQNFYQFIISALMRTSLLRQCYW